jgi:hypothetical protein
MKAITVHRLVEAYTQANNLGWKTFYNNIWRQLKKRNRRFCKFLEEFIVDQESELCLEEFELDYLKETAALILLCRDLNPVISSSTILAIDQEIHFSAKEEDRLEEIGEAESQTRSEDQDDDEGEDKEFLGLTSDRDEDEIFEQRDLRRKKIYQEGRRYLIFRHLDFFQEFKKFIAEISCGEETLVKALYRLTDLMFAVYSRQEDNVSIDNQFKEILNLKNGQ